MKAKLNPDGAFVRNLKKRINQNNGYCPCKLLKTPDTKCPCMDFRKGAAATAGSTSMKRRMKPHADLSGLRRDL